MRESHLRKAHGLDGKHVADIWMWVQSWAGDFSVVITGILTHKGREQLAISSDSSDQTFLPQF